MAKETILKELMIKKFPMNPVWDDLSKAVSMMKGKYLQVEILAAKNESSGKIEFFAEEVKPEKAFGELSPKNGADVIACMNDFAAKKCEVSIRLTAMTKASATADATFAYTVAAPKKTASNAEIVALMEQVVAEGKMTKEIAQENDMIMNLNRFPVHLQKLVWQDVLANSYDKPGHHQVPYFRDPEPSKKSASVLSRAMTYALSGVATIFEGDASVGKTVGAGTIAQLLNKPLVVIGWSNETTHEDIYGTKTTGERARQASDCLRLELADAYLQYQLTRDPAWRKKAAQFLLCQSISQTITVEQEVSAYTEAVRKGYMVVFNEANMADPNLYQELVNPLTDGTGFVNIPGIGRTDIHPSFRLIATQNPEYTGTNTQNGATTTRFACIAFPYPETIKDTLKMMSAKWEKMFGTLDDEAYAQLDAFYKRLYPAVQNGDFDNHCMNIRGIGNAIKAFLVNPEISLFSSVNDCVIGTCPSDEREALLSVLADTVSC